jgi:hypothetical protein
MLQINMSFLKEHLCTCILFCTGTTHAFWSTASPLSAAAAAAAAAAVTQAPKAAGSSPGTTTTTTSSSSGGAGAQQQQKQQGPPAAPKLTFDQLHEQYQAQLTLRNIQGVLATS